MTYTIRPAYHSGPPTEKQRTHPRFAEEPVIGSFHVRRGSHIVLTEEQYQAAKHQIDTLLEAEAITVTKEGEEAPPTYVPVASTPAPGTENPQEPAPLPAAASMPVSEPQTPSEPPPVEETTTSASSFKKKTRRG